MKFLIALFLGLMTGFVISAALLIYNPTVNTPGLSPLEVSRNSLMRLNYSAVAKTAIAYSNHGEAVTRPHPARILQLWEAPIRKTTVMLTPLGDATGDFAGLGIKFSSQSEASSLVHGEALVDSDWHVVLPGRGSLFVAQVQNYWGFLKDVVLPSQWSSSKSWKGKWHGNTTAGPGALGTGFVVGGYGIYAGATSESTELLSASAYSSKTGAVSLDGSLLIDLPTQAVLTETPIQQD